MLDLHGVPRSKDENQIQISREIQPGFLDVYCHHHAQNHEEIQEISPVLQRVFSATEHYNSAVNVVYV